MGHPGVSVAHKYTVSEGYCPLQVHAFASVFSASAPASFHNVYHL